MKNIALMRMFYFSADNCQCPSPYVRTRTTPHVHQSLCLLKTEFDCENSLLTVNNKIIYTSTCRGHQVSSRVIIIAIIEVSRINKSANREKNNTTLRNNQNDVEHNNKWARNSR